MIELPLFPLNTVLFPGMPLRLHIFEERYKTMINECIDADKPFGVVLIETGDEALGPVAEPHLIGTTAHIVRVERLPFGRLNILAIGRDRFRIQTLHHDKAYLSAIVDLIPLAHSNNADIHRAEQQLRPLLNRYLRALSEAGFQIEDATLPEDALALAYLSAVILQTDSQHKQDILEALNTHNFMSKLVSLYKREVALLDVMLAPPASIEDNLSPFSLN
jgi:Lon protease-like protein